MKVVAFGGGHGLSASLRALRMLRTDLDLDITAVITRYRPATAARAGRAA